MHARQQLDWGQFHCNLALHVLKSFRMTFGAIRVHEENCGPKFHGRFHARANRVVVSHEHVN